MANFCFQLPFLLTLLLFGIFMGVVYNLGTIMDYLARFGEAAARIVLIGLGCVLVAAWAKYSQHRQRVTGALLVAPADVEQEHLRPVLPSWARPNALSDRSPSPKAALRVSRWTTPP